MLDVVSGAETGAIVSADAAQGVKSVSVALVGSGGAGVITAGEILLQAAAKAGYYGIQTRTVGPQIRGGESAALVRLSTEPVSCHKDAFDILLAIDWRNAERFAAEIPLNAESLIITDPAAGPIPELIAIKGARAAEFPLAELVKTVEGGRPNMVACGVIAKLAGLPVDAIEAVVSKKLAKKGEAAVKSSMDAVNIGIEASADLGRANMLREAVKSDAKRWFISGNQACGLGALKGGVRFVAAYPITPSTEVLEYMSPQLPKLGGKLVQAEDEIASINMCLGASYAGTPTLTATSGPGLALMIETLGLSVSAEIPVVVVNVQRGGPSTGVPTKSEQSDLNIAVNGLHGDAPHLVVAPTSVGDCVTATQWSVYLAEALQCPAILMSDQFMGQAVAVVEEPKPLGLETKRQVVHHAVGDFHRYENTESGISPMSLPGSKGLQYTSEGLAHAENAIPSSQAEDHMKMLDKRQRKLDKFDFGEYWADVEGEGEVAIVTWGSTTAAAKEAAQVLTEEGTPTKVIGMRLVAPLQLAHLKAELKGVKRILIVEQTHSGQFLKYLHGHTPFAADQSVKGYHKPGPLMIRPADIINQIDTWS